MAAPVLGHPAWSVSALRRFPPGRAGLRHTAGTTVGGGGNGRGYRRSLSADAWVIEGGLLMLSQHFNALSARRGYRRSLSADARYGEIVDALSSELTLQRAPWTALALANSPWLWSPLRPFSRRWSPRSPLVCHRAPLRVPAPFTNSRSDTTTVSPQLADLSSVSRKLNPD